MKMLVKAALLACSCIASLAAHAAWPERTITIVVPYTPGGAADALARQLAQRMGVKLGTSVIVDNRAGASGTIGEAYVARAANDGYTILYDATPYSINPSLFANLPFSEKNLRPLSLVSLTPNVLIVRADSPIKDQKDLIARAKAAPGKLTFASGGGGTVQRLAAELYRQGLRLDALHIPYKSGGLAISDMMGGQIDFMFGTIVATNPLIASGKLRASAISSSTRSPLLPNVPTVAESVLPGYAAYEWNGLLLPAGTPEPIVTRLHQVVSEILQEDDMKKRFADLGAQPVGSSPAEFADFLKNESAKWAGVIRKGEIKPD